MATTRVRPKDRNRYEPVEMNPDVYGAGAVIYNWDHGRFFTGRGRGARDVQHGSVVRFASMVEAETKTLELNMRPEPNRQAGGREKPTAEPTE